MKYNNQIFYILMHKMKVTTCMYIYVIFCTDMRHPIHFVSNEFLERKESRVTAAREVEVRP